MIVLPVDLHARALGLVHLHPRGSMASFKLVREGFAALRLVLAHKPDSFVTHSSILAHDEAHD